MSDQEIFNFLFELAAESEDKEGAVAAALVRESNILISSSSSPDGVYHAEYLVLQSAKEKGFKVLPDDVIFTTVEPCSRRSSGRPVGDCCAVLIEAGIRRIIYAAGDPSQSLNTQQKLRAANIICEQVKDSTIIEKARTIFNATQLNPNKGHI